jgi:multidrug efflux system outer membrane protein
MPCSWRVEADKETTFVNMRWWESLGDPVLNELIETALHQNKDLQVAIYRVCEFFARYTVARAPLLPQINLDATAVKERIPPAESLTGKGVITPFYTYMFTLSYELDFWGLVQSQAHAACAQALAAIQNRRTVVLTLVTAVASAYIQLRELDRELKISFDTLEDRKEFLRLATIRYEGGLTSEIEVTQAAALYEEALAEITFLEQAIPQQENLISVLIGLPSTNIVRGREIDAFCFPPVIPAGLPAELLIRRPDILAAEFQLIAANAEIGAARAAFFPQINLIALFGGESFKFSTLFSGKNRIWEFGTSIMQPIFTGGQLTGELNIAVAQKQEALYTYEQTILTAISEVNNALIALRQTQELVRVQEGNVAANKEYLRLSWLQYYEGQTDYLTVLDAETRLFDAQIQLTQAQGGVFIALVEVYKALGGGWVIDADCVLRKE